MTEKITSIRGMHDVLPSQSPSWQQLEGLLRQLMHQYAYQEIRMPVVEKTALFKRSIGDVTDIVQKEMYTFDDRNGDSLTLRPEGTASCVRAGIENGLLHNQVQKLWYMGPMFRHERPQKGRYRQFSQLGVEVFGLSGIDIDVELILMSQRLWQLLGIEKDVQLQINSIGTTADRETYKTALVAFLNKHKEQLDEESLERLQRNPLRILDSKNKDIQALLLEAPKLSDVLAPESKAFFDAFCQRLDAMNISYQVNHRLVRGLDYYNHTVFEWVTEALGAQGTLCAGGRYDGLVEQLGGSATPGIGFAIGLDRLLVLLESQAAWQPNANVDVYLLAPTEASEVAILQLAETLRASLPKTAFQMHCGGGSMKSQIKKADKSGAAIALIIGDEELQNNMVTIKYLRAEKPQERLTNADVPVYLHNFFNPTK